MVRSLKAKMSCSGKGVLQTSVVLWVLLPLLSACATTAEFRKLERDVNRLKKNASAADSSSTVQADLLTQIEALQNEVQVLQGRLDVAEHRSTQALEEAQEARRAVARNATGQVSQLAPTTGDLAAQDALSDTEAVAQPPMVTAPAAPMQSPPSAASSSAPHAVTATPPAATGKGQDALDILASDPELAAAADGKVTTAEELQAYRNAYAAWRSGDTQTCIDRFRQFLQTYPPSGYADDASYWMADCYFKQGDYKTAIVRFDDVVRNYPKGSKAPDALYRQGESLLKLGPGYSKAASKAFERVVKEYPASPRVEEAQKQLELLGG